MNTEIKRMDSAPKETSIPKPMTRPPVEESQPMSKTLINEVSAETLAFEKRLQEIVRDKPLVALAGAAVVGFIAQTILGKRGRHEA